MGNKQVKLASRGARKARSSSSLLFKSGSSLRTPSAVATHRHKSMNDPEIFTAIDNGDAETVRRLVKSAKNINKVDMNGLTPLHCAALNGHEECVRILIEARCQLRSCQLRLSTLHFAAQNGNAAIINMLIDYGEAVNARDLMGDTPLSAAVQVNNVDAARALIARGARLQLHVVVSAVENGFDQLLRELINLRPEVVGRVNLDKFCFTKASVPCLKLLFFAGHRFSENFLTEITPMDWQDFCLSGTIRLPPAHYNRDEDVREFGEFTEWFNQNMHQPMSLKCLARISFRRQCSVDIQRAVDEIGLPKRICEFLLLQDF